MTTDSELLEACRAGRTAAFAELVDRYQGLVAAVTFAATGDRNLSEDLAQDTFVAAWRRLHELREPASFRAWLCSIARNLAAKARRRFGRELAVDAPQAIDAAPAIDDTLADAQAEAIVWRSLEALSLTYREPLILYYREGRSAQQVADALGLSVAAVEQRLSRGRKQLEAGVEALVERSLERSRPRRKLAMAVVGAIGGGSPVSAPAKGGAAMKMMTIGGATAVAIAGGYATCLTRGDEAPDEPVAEARSAGEEPVRSRSGIAPEVIESVETRDREQSSAHGAAELAFELTRLSETSVGVNLLGGASLVTSYPFAADSALDPPRTISGRVLDAHGEPVSGAIVIGGKFLTLRTGDTVTSDAGAITDAEGRFSFTLGHEKPGSVVAFDRRGVSEAVSIPAGTDARTVDLRLAEPASWSGTVKQGDDAVAATVLLTTAEPRRIFTAKADESGRFRLDYVPPGTYEATATLSYDETGTVPTNDNAEVVIAPGQETQHDFVLPTGALVVTDVAWPKQHDATMVSYYLLPGDHSPATADELRAITKSGAGRSILVGGDNLHDAMSFNDVTPGRFTACAVSQLGRDHVLGFDCAALDVTDATDTLTVELDPFAD